MKKILVLTVLLGLVVSANAALTVVVRFPDQPLNIWQEYENSKLNISPSDELYIGFSEGTPGVPADVTTGDVFYLGISEGPGSMDVGPASAVAGVSMTTVNNAQLAADNGIQNNFVMATIEDAAAVNSMLFYNVLFHCEGEGDVTFFAYDEDFLVADTQVIHQVPEPATMVLLGLGGLLLRRKK